MSLATPEDREPSTSSRLRSTLERGLGHFCSALLALMVINVTWQVASRYLLAEPSSFTEELARFLLIWLGLFGGVYALCRRLHVAIDLLQRRSGAEARLHLARLCQLSVIAFAVLVPISGGMRLALLTFHLEQRSAALGIPLAWVYMALPIAGLLLATIAACDLIAASRSEDSPGQRAGSAP